MSQVVAPFLFLALAAALFFSYINPGLETLRAFKDQAARLDDISTKANNLDKNYANLNETYNRLPPEDLRRLNQILPDTIDVVRMIIQIDTLAAKNGIELRAFSVPSAGGDSARSQRSSSARRTQSTQASTASTESDVTPQVFTLDCTGPYEGFKQFLFDLESSLSLLDVANMTITIDDRSQDQRTKAVATPGSEMTYVLDVQAYTLNADLKEALTPPDASGGSEEQ